MALGPALVAAQHAAVEHVPLPPALGLQRKEARHSGTKSRIKL
jgi:hypothetical protein